MNSFLHDLFLVVKCDSVAYLFCPQYESLSLQKILHQASANEDVWPYFPDQKDIHKLPRQWVVNILYTIVGRPFADWVQEQINGRNEKLANDHNLMIELDPEIAAAFKASTQISSKSFAESIVSFSILFSNICNCSQQGYRCQSPQVGNQASPFKNRDAATQGRRRTQRLVRLDQDQTHHRT